jgi:hypothetical protein
LLVSLEPLQNVGELASRSGLEPLIHAAVRPDEHCCRTVMPGDQDRMTGPFHLLYETAQLA